jgi:hypothetical protein
MKLPQGAKEHDGKFYDKEGRLIELFDNQWLVVKNLHNTGWWRYHDHYDQGGMK